MLLGYCILKAGPGVQLPPGLGGAPLNLVEQSGLAIAVSEMPALGGVPSMDDVQTFADVIRQLHEQRTVLPLRYGTAQPTREQWRKILEDKKDAIGSVLEVLEGCDEWTIKMAAEVTLPKPPAHADSGLAYLSARQAAYRQAESLERELEDQAGKTIADLGGIVRKWRCELSKLQRQAVVAIHLLVPRSQSEILHEKLRQCQADGAKIIELSGPWPPYNFAALTPEEAAASTNLFEVGLLG